MSTVHDTTNLRAYKNRQIPAIDGSLPPFLAQELQSISSSLTAVVAALKSIEARIVAGGL
jgi:hypothetical protein